ncbi:MAG TPA: hypothetical protein VNC50_06730 [Planctomycetia bacterium]|nr:hypothetical protein [Planctomycetia bacterium]
MPADDVAVAAVAEPEGLRFTELHDKVTRADTVTSGMFTGVIFLFGVVCAFGIMWLLSVDRLVVANTAAQVLLAPPPEDGEEEGKTGYNADIGDIPEEMPNTEVENIQDSSLPDLANDLLQAIMQTDFTDPTQDARNRGGQEGGPGGRGEKGTGIGRGGVKREQRWVLEYGDSQLSTYKKILDFYDIHLAAVRSGRVELAHQFSNGPGQRVQVPPNDLWFQATDAERREKDRDMLRQSGVNADGAIIAQFYPKNLEATLYKIEMDYAKSEKGVTDEKQIKKTVFGIRGSGGGAYEIFVVDMQTSS